MNYVAVDLGANGGKVCLGQVADGQFEMSEVYRFDNRPVEREGRYVWDIEAIVDHVERGIARADGQVDAIESIGVDTWGLDFGLLADGDLIASPYSYRDPTLVSTREDLEAQVGRTALFETTGITNWNTPNTICQYHYLAHEEPELFEQADRLLMTPQLVSYLLGAEPRCEPTIASTTQLFDPETRTWATDLFEYLDLPTNPLPEIRPAGTPIGCLRSDLTDSLSSAPDIVLPASHDTAGAVAGLPLSAGSKAFLSAGTWFLCGVELDSPVRTDDAFAVGASNELGIEDTVRFLKNVTGFFLLEECRAAWEAEDGGENDTDGEGEYDYGHLLDAMASVEPFGPLVDPDDPLFEIDRDMPEAIREYCRETDQSIPRTVGEVTRCVLESLAAKTAIVLEDILTVAGSESETLHLGGGGAYNTPFCRMLAGAIERPVVAGPAEATAAGNVLSQALATGELTDLAAGRELVENGLAVETYRPKADDRWTTARERMGALVDSQVGE
jgi:rhamnulokinase